MKYLVMGFDGKIVRQMIACVKVISDETLLVIFKTGLKGEVRWRDIGCQWRLAADRYGYSG